MAVTRDEAKLYLRIDNDVEDASKEYADSKDLNEYLCKITKEEQYG